MQNKTQEFSMLWYSPADMPLYYCLKEIVDATHPSSLGIATAFLSVEGIRLINDLIAKKEGECRLVVGIDNAITHPKALETAQRAGYSVKIGVGGDGIFHAKMLVGGTAFNTKDILQDTCCMYIGSANFTRSGLMKNKESVLVSCERALGSEASCAFASIWREGRVLTPALLNLYSETFSKVNRERPPEAILDLGISDSDLSSSDGMPEKCEEYVGHETSTIAWTGLESFTGEYALQVEFPRAPGMVLGRMLKEQFSDKDSVELLCEDEKIRSMKYHYYEDNGMYRLNVPNSVPGVNWVRENKEGMAIVQLDPVTKKLRFRILLPGKELEEMRKRSILLGSFGRTATRYYGWL